jgi:hypothetical protein
MFELHVVVAGIFMFNILELIMKIVPNYPTGGVPPPRPALVAGGGAAAGTVFPPRPPPLPLLGDFDMT